MGRSVDENSVIKIVEYECGEFVGLAKEIGRQIKALPSAQPDLQPTCNQLATDCISRQAVIDMIMGQPPEAHYPSWYAEQIKALPSAHPERLTKNLIVMDVNLGGQHD